MLARMVSALAVFGLASCAFAVGVFLDFALLPRPFAGSALLTGLGSALLPLRTRGELGLERLVLRRLRIERVERGADVGALGELAQHVGRAGGLLVEVDGAAHPREGHAADAGVAREGDDGIGQGQLVGGKLGRIGIVKALRRRIVCRIEAVGRHALQESLRLLGAGSGFAGRDPDRREVAVAIERQHAGAVLRLGHVLLQLGLDQILQLPGDRGVVGG